MRDLIKKLALKNAVEYGGKANLKSVFSKFISEYPDAKKDIKYWISVVKEVIEEINSMEPEEQKKLLMEIWPDAFEKKKEEEKELEDLPNAEKGKVVLRMAPGITGYPHIGHVYAFLINYLYSLKYNGDYVIRYEDTDPRLAKLEYYNEFDFFIDFFEIKYKEKKIISKDFMGILYDYGRKLIELGKAYVCLKSKEEISKARQEGIELEDRNRSVEENLELFDKMLEGGFGEGEAVVLFKGDMRNPNTRLRDPTMFRIVIGEHPLVGDKYIVWPSYDFAVAVCDGLQGVTHIIRSAEFSFAKELHEEIRRILGFHSITIIETSRVGIKNNLTSKRKIRKLIEEGKVMGWDDPRLVTLRGLIRRGIVKETFYEFVKNLGITKTQPEIEFEIIAAINRKILDPKVRRLFLVPDYIELEVEGIEGGEVIIPYHPTNKELGSRKIRYKNVFYVPKEVMNYEEFRLIHLFNVKIKEIKENKIIGEFSGKGIKKDIRKLQWVPKGFEKWIELWIINDLLKEDGSFNEESLVIKKVPIEENFEEIKVGEIIQAERVGFCRKDSEGVLILGHK